MVLHYFYTVGILFTKRLVGYLSDPDILPSTEPVFIAFKLVPGNKELLSKFYDAVCLKI